MHVAGMADLNIAVDPAVQRALHTFIQRFMGDTFIKRYANLCEGFINGGWGRVFFFILTDLHL